MLKTSRIALGFAAALVASGAAAQGFIAPKTSQSDKVARSTQAAPPANYQGQWWTHPLGCEYSRAGRPGETVWYIIVNTGRDGCPQHIVINGFSGIY